LDFDRLFWYFLCAHPSSDYVFEQKRIMNLIEIREKVDELIIRRKTAVEECRTIREKLTQAENHLTYVNEAQIIAQFVAKEIQQKAHSKISGVVSRCLETVFVGKDVYGLRIHFDRKRKKTEARIVLVKNGHEIDDPKNADSGGVIDVAALALRASCIVLAKPNVRRLITLDEPFKFVDEVYRMNVCSLLEGLAKEFKFQFLMVTHINELKIGKIIEL